MIGDNFICAVCPEDFFLEFTVRVVDPPIAGDFDFDDRVGFRDFITLSTWFDRIPDTNTRPAYHRGDADLDADVDFDDFQILSANYGTVREPPPTAVPEPAAAMLLGLALLGLGAAFRRDRSL